MSDNDGPDAGHIRPDGASDELVAAMGKVSEAYEWLERARGHLYDFHQMMGHTDATFGDAVDMLRDASATEQADVLEREVVGRNAIDGRWSFQIVEEFDDTYARPVGAIEQRLRDELMAGKRHVFESEMKERRRTRGHPAHRARP